jgi:hypothetical protein
MKPHFVLLTEAGANEVGNDSGDETNLFDLLRTPPMAIIGGVLHENPFFVPQEAFLAELQERQPRNP